MEEAFNTAYDDYADALFRHCSFRISDRERAVDIVQETFMKTWDSLRNGTEIKNWKAFLFRVLNNLIIDEYRKKKSSSLDSLLEQEGVTDGTFTDLHADLSLEILEKDAQAEQVHLLETAFKTLPDSYTQLLLLRYTDGLPIKEVANILHETENVVSVRIHRALHRLKSIIATIEKSNIKRV